jgi:hypothetical protein
MKIRTLPLLLALALLGCPPAGPADFRTLAEKAYPEGGKPIANAMDNLWTALFKLPKWHFLMTTTTAAARQPAIETIDGEQWLLVFTDLQMLRLYAIANKNVVGDGGAPNTMGAPPAGDAGLQLNLGAPTGTPNPYLASDGTPLVVSMTSEEVKTFLGSYSGAPVSGIRFNEGSRKGWFASIKSVGNIRDYLKGSGKL